MKARIIPGSSREDLSQMRRWYKLLLIVLHNDFGFGAERLNRVISSFDKLCDESRQDEIFWEHADKLLIDDLKFNFQKENYKKVDK